MKTDENWDIVEVKTDDYESPVFTKIKISNAILYALKNNDKNVYERVNFIYKKKVFNIINWVEEKTNYEKPVNIRYNWPVVDKVEDTEPENKPLEKQEEIEDWLKHHIDRFLTKLSSILIKDDNRWTVIVEKN